MGMSLLARCDAGIFQPLFYSIFHRKPASSFCFVFIAVVVQVFVVLLSVRVNNVHTPPKLSDIRQHRTASKYHTIE